MKMKVKVTVRANFYDEKSRNSPYCRVINKIILKL